MIKVIQARRWKVPMSKTGVMGWLVGVCNVTQVVFLSAEVEEF